MSDKHAILAPSSADRWMVCPGSVLLEKDLSDTESDYAKEGTLAHKAAAEYLTTGTVSMASFSEEDCTYILDYCYAIQEASQGHQLLIEKSLPIGHITLEQGAEGTSDAIILKDDVMEIHDFKFGMGNKVYAKNNRQLMLYALGALHEFSCFGDYRKFTLFIHQPRINHVDEWDCTLDDLKHFADEVKFRAEFIWRILEGDVDFKPKEDLVPYEKGCLFCKAKATCPALAEHTMKTLSNDFTNLENKPIAKLGNILTNVGTVDNAKLAWFMTNLGLIEDWMRAVRARVEQELLAGREVPGFKLVAGRMGNRKWNDDKLVEEEMKAMRLKVDEMYKTKIISPPDAEKLLKKNPKLWKKLSEYIVQEPGKPSVAPVTDPRPMLELNAVENDFKVLEEDVI